MTVDAERLLTHLLRLDDDLDAIPDVPLLTDAYNTFNGMRLVRDPPFACFVSFICSAQMHLNRIHGMQMRLAESFGDPVTFDGEAHPAAATDRKYEAAREYLYI